MPLAVEAAVVAAARAGGDSLDRLIALVWPEAYRIAYSILQDAGLAEDAAQEACAALAGALPRLKTDAAFYAWSYRIIVRQAITTGRTRQRTQALETLPERAVNFDRSSALDLAQALGALPLAQRGAILLHYYAGLKSNEIAAATGLPASTIRFHLMLARRNLRAALSVTHAQSTQPCDEVLTDAH